jgi:hypothetical protein
MKQQKYIRATAAAGLVIASLTVAPAANADPALGVSDKAGVSQVNSISNACEVAVKGAELKARKKLSPEICKVQVVTSYSDAKKMSFSDVERLQGSLSASDYDSLSKAAAAGTVRSRFYLQQVNHITDSETQSGTFYYDGVRAWVTNTYRGVTGSHLCMIDWAVGFGVSPQNCYESGSTSVRILSQQWLMSPFLNGFPISWSETYTLRVNAVGQVW